jgi:hypothetical protein
MWDARSFAGFKAEGQISKQEIAKAKSHSLRISQQ